MTDLIDLLEEANNLARKAESQDDRLKAEEKYTLLIGLAKEFFKPILADGLNGRGLNRRMMGKDTRSDAYVDFREAYEVAKTDEQMAESLLGQADIHRIHHGNNPAGHWCIDQALLNHIVNGTLLEAKAHDFRGMLLEYNERKFDEAMKVYVTAWEIAKEQVKNNPGSENCQNRLSQIEMHILGCCQNTGTGLDEALAVGLATLSRVETMGHVTETINMTAILGRVYHKMKDDEKSIIYYKKSLDLAFKQDYGRAITPSVMELAAIYLGRGNVEEAVPLVERFVQGMNKGEVTKTDLPGMKPYFDELAKGYDCHKLNVPGFDEVRKLF